jgi:hypothetical protein
MAAPRRASLPILLVALTIARPSAATAQASPFAGAWSFTMTGDNTGGGTAAVDSAGRITGRGYSSIGQASIALRGSVTQAGSLALKGVPSGNTSLQSTFTGVADAATGTAGGTWVNAATHLRGTWTARRGPAKGVTVVRGMRCGTSNGASNLDEFEPVLLSATYGAGLSRVSIIVLQRTPDDELQNWLLLAQADGVRGPGLYAIDGVAPGSSIGYRAAHAPTMDKQPATGRLIVDRITPPGTDDGRIAGSFDMKSGTYRVNCMFHVPITPAAVLSAERAH